MPFRMSDYIQMLQPTCKLNNDRGMQKEMDKEEVFVGKQSHTGLHVS